MKDQIAGIKSNKIKASPKDVDEIVQAAKK